MKIIYRPHLKRRLKERKFPENYPQLIYKRAKLKFFDIQTKHNIAIAKMNYAGKTRNLSISYDMRSMSQSDKIGVNIEIITIHPISDEDIKSRIKSKRWQKI